MCYTEEYESRIEDLSLFWCSLYSSFLHSPSPADSPCRRFTWFLLYGDQGPRFLSLMMYLLNFHVRNNFLPLCLEGCLFSPNSRQNSSCQFLILLHALNWQGKLQCEPFSRKAKSILVPHWQMELQHELTHCHFLAALPHPPPPPAPLPLPPATPGPSRRLHHVTLPCLFCVTSDVVYIRRHSFCV